ncbi:hypothetical protein LWI29_019682 [Acer saccharum]|uniref:Citrate transporter-like domain-containing protein n=1 Tax=Acer saccharum TaxID=4024 RepID=A0AA39STC1_ACESA|nr:hypothetical protein LWI29_019682 [Acer saccharum]
MFRKACLSLVTMGMLVSLLMGLNMSWTTIAAALALTVLDFKDARPNLEKVSYSILIFFCRMFITVDGFNRIGIPSNLWDLMETYAQIDHIGGIAVLAVVILVLSNLASNIPTVRNSKRWNNGYVQNETRIGQLDCDVQERKEDKGVWQISNHVSCKRNPNGATGLDKDDQQLLGKAESHDKLNKGKNKWVLYSKRNSPLHNLNYKLLFGKTKEVGTFKDQSSSSYSEEDREPFINSVKTTGGCSMQQKNLIEKNGAISGVKPVSVTVKVSNKAGRGINDDNGLDDGMGNHERSGPVSLE